MSHGHPSFSRPGLEGHCAAEGHLDRGQGPAHSKAWGAAFRRNRKRNWCLEKIRDGVTAVCKPTKEVSVFLCSPEDRAGRRIVTRETFSYLAAHFK